MEAINDRQAVGVEPIAICGMAMRLPGGVRDAESFWDLLYNKKSGQSPVPKNRYSVDTWYGPGKLGHVNSKVGYFIEDLEIDCADTAFWTMTNHEIEAMDPQQRIMLEIVYECLENAGQKPSNLYGCKVGVWSGTFEGDWLELDGRDPLKAHTYRLTGYGDYMAANRIHYEFGFTGPSSTVRTACSSSMVALHDACQALYLHECESAIVAGSNLIFSPRTSATMQEQGVLSPTGSCKTFDADADGYARGEAVSAIYVKRLSDAIRNGDPVRAVIRAATLNAGGKVAQITSPSALAHERLMRQAYELAGLSESISKTAMVECHGTGTKVGDPVEAKAVGQIWKEEGVYIGSVKPNIGHGEGASGLSSVIKMVLALEKRTIPPNINFNKPHPQIFFDEWKLRVPTEPMPWPADRHERVSVNSFGIGGSNAHVVLESARSCGVMSENVSDIPPKDYPNLLVFSAKHAESLKCRIKDHSEYLSKYPRRVQDLAFTLASHRDHFVSRAFSIATSGCVREPSRIANVRPAVSPELIYVFTGQGAQWAQMGLTMLTHNSTFRKTIEHLDLILQHLASSPSWSLLSELQRSSDSSRMLEAGISQPCCTAIQIALVHVLRSWDVTPSAVVGHSSGEIAAAYACGILSAEEALMVAYYRGYATQRRANHLKGAMAAVSMGYAAVQKYLKPGVIVGCDNSPNSVTLTGDKSTLEGVLSDIRLDSPSTLTRLLRVDCAYHSHHMSSVEKTYASLISKRISTKTSSIPMYSSVTTELIPPLSALETSYWVRNLVSPVLFYGAVSNILTAKPGPKVFLEIGPHKALQGPLRQIFQSLDSKDEYVHTLERGRDATSSLLSTAGELWLHNIAINLPRVIGQGRQLIDLPTYPWHYDEPLWLESRLSKEWRFRQHAHHDILGYRVLETSDNEPTWRNILRLDDTPWIKEHEVAGDILFPGVGFICMAAEAVRQLSGLADFTVRQVHIKTALALQYGQEMEVITSLRKQSLTISLESVWYDFAIYSLNGNVWVKHAAGQVRSGSEVDRTASTIRDLPRPVSSRSWYQVMKRYGLNYGPRFVGLQSISAEPLQREAVATVENKAQQGESRYAIHPTILDCAIQIFCVAHFHGLMRNFKFLAVPTFIDELYVKPPKSVLRMKAKAGEFSKNGISGDLVAISEGETVIDMKGLSITPISRLDHTSLIDPYAAVELEWKPDINLVDVSKLFSIRNERSELNGLLDEFGLLNMLHAYEQLQDAVPVKEHLNFYLEWLEEITYQARLNQYPGVKDSSNLTKFDQATKLERAKLIYKRLEGTASEASAVAIQRITSYCTDIFKGGSDPLELLLYGQILHQVYDVMQNTEYSPYIELLAHCNPNMRILEIGAGTGATTATVLPSLMSTYGERMYSSYVYTDVSAGFFMQAKQRFKDFSGITYSVLDISRDPLVQGFQAESFDLVIACNVLHATPSLLQTLTHVRTLLRPTGQLFLQELCPATKWINYIMGVLPGWWLGAHDGRRTEPYVSPARWDKELRQAGFSGIQTLFFDQYLNNNIISCPKSSPLLPKQVTLLTHNADSPVTSFVANMLNEKGLGVKTCKIDEIPTKNQVIISILDFDYPYLHDSDTSEIEKLIAFIGHAQNSGLLWITGAAQLSCLDARYGMILGLARTVRTELKMDFATLELVNFEQASLAVIGNVFDEFQKRRKDQTLDPTMEWAFAEEQVWISRYHWQDIEQGLEETNTAKMPVVKLEIKKPGITSSLYWKRIGAEELSAESVEVEVDTVGLNFKDVLVATGIVDDIRAIGRGFGFEAAGVITRVGTKVKNLNIGDKIFCITSGGFATNFCIPAGLCVKIPDRLSLVEAATMPCVFGTAIYCLEDVAKITKNQTILIHSASGGVGIAAIQVAQLAGATIYCTVGNESKAEFLVAKFGISKDCIFHSRDTTFLSAIMHATNGRGVDVVLNSLSGELLHASWRCVAEFGIMVEIGRRDFIGHGKLGMEMFESNRSFVGADLSHLVDKRPEKSHDLLTRMTTYLKDGKIQPIPLHEVFDASQIEDAFRTLQKGQHIGKVVVQMPKSCETFAGEQTRSELILRNDSAYLLIGGLGGLGRSIATWLIEHGARNLVLFSRTAGRGLQNHDFIRELQAMGCAVQLISGDVTVIKDVERLISSLTLNVAGVFQTSMVLEDGPLLQMTGAQWRRVVAPKVTGTWNIHDVLHRLQSQPVDFFILFSSLGAMAGQWGQANYAAANTYLDSFVQYRHSLGLACSVLNVGVVEDVGYLTQHPEKLEKLKSMSIGTMHEEDLLDAVQLAIIRSGPNGSTLSKRSYVNHGQIGLGVRSTLPLTAPNNRIMWRRDPRMAVYRNLDVHKDETLANEEGNKVSFKARLREFNASTASLRAVETSEFLSHEIGVVLGGFLMRSEERLNINASLADLGVDSLLSIELMNWMKQHMGIDITVLEMMRTGSISEIGQLAQAKMIAKAEARG